MAKAEHQSKLRTITGDADDDAVGGALPLHRDPFALPWQISTVAALGDDAFKPGHKCQRFLRLVDARRSERRAAGTRAAVRATFRGDIADRAAVDRRARG